MGAAHTPKESLQWKLTLGEKSLAALWTWTRISIASGFFSQTLYQLSYPTPVAVVAVVDADVLFSGLGNATWQQAVCKIHWPSKQLSFFMAKNVPHVSSFLCLTDTVCPCLIICQGCYIFMREKRTEACGLWKDNIWSLLLTQTLEMLQEKNWGISWETVRDEWGGRGARIWAFLST